MQELCVCMEVFWKAFYLELVLTTLELVKQ